ncbi:MAG TPA: glycosyltransferase [Nitrososphaerales archaeon]|nr:glycosyltransferase [Nitrososphaerales archaeon]
MSPSRVYFAVFGSGLGHSARILDLADRLRAPGDEFRFSTSGQQALGFLSSHVGKEAVVVSPHLDVEWTEDGGFSSAQFLPRFRRMVSAFGSQVSFEEGSMAKFDPKVVVSDSRLSAVIAGKAKSYPVVTMLNQFKVALPPRFRNRVGLFYERIAGNSLGLLWSLSDEVLMTDLPPPYTIGEVNLEGTNVSNVVKFVGFTSPRSEVTQEKLERAKRMLGIDGRPLVFCQISGPEATKGRFVETLVQTMEKLAATCNVVISRGNPRGSSEPRRMASGAWVFDWCPIRDELFQLSSLIVARAGHRTIGQCIDSGKPAVVIPIRNHSEQLGNAKKFEKLGLGVQIRSEKLTPQKLLDSMQDCLSDPKYQSRVDAVRKISKKYDGLEGCAEVVRAYK